jgi:hypothetical protein
LLCPITTNTSGARLMDVSAVDSIKYITHSAA